MSSLWQTGTIESASSAVNGELRLRVGALAQAQDQRIGDEVAPDCGNFQVNPVVRVDRGRIPHRARWLSGIHFPAGPVFSIPMVAPVFKI